MRRTLLDTNIFGLIAVDEERDSITSKLTGPSEWILYASSVSRMELRSVPQSIRGKNRNVRVDLLTIYDNLIGKHTYPVTDSIRGIAAKYHAAFLEVGGTTPERKLLDDFLIVATASFHQLDMVVSDDRNTMCSTLARKGYFIVNTALSLSMPACISYAEMKKQLGGL